jgi:NifU-like N terminal domain
MLSAIAAEHVQNPRNRGALENATHVGTCGTPGDGPYVRIWLLIKDGRIEKANYNTQRSCGKYDSNSRNRSRGGASPSINRGRPNEDSWRLAGRQRAICYICCKSAALRIGGKMSFPGSGGGQMCFGGVCIPNGPGGPQLPSPPNYPPGFMEPAGVPFPSNGSTCNPSGSGVGCPPKGNNTGSPSGNNPNNPPVAAALIIQEPWCTT